MYRSQALFQDNEMKVVAQIYFPFKYVFMIMATYLYIYYKNAQQFMIRLINPRKQSQCRCWNSFGVFWLVSACLWDIN